MSKSTQKRNGITLIEVMFAMGVMLIGLLGIASVIPVAANYARQTLENDIGTVYASHAVALINSSKFLEPKDLVFVNDETPGLGSDYLRNRPRREPGNFPAAGFQVGTTPSFCIDPWFLNHALSYRDTSGSVNGFHAGVFPYYDSDYSPAVSPNATAMPTGDPNQFPRLWRVFPEIITGSPALSRRIGGAIQSVFQNDDSLSMEFPDDPTLYPQQIAYTSQVGAASNIAVRRLAEGHYSWIATVTPSNSVIAAGAMKLSVVIIRDRVFVPHPSNPLTSTSPLNYAVSADAESNATNERLALITGAIGFVGGLGGSVTVEASTDMNDSIKAGQWVMLSQRNFNPSLPAVHVWYEVNNVSEPSPSTSFTGGWKRTVSLVGPDWPQPDMTSNATHMTIVENAIAVKEIEITL
ncbi:hypothetical protein Poly24_16090 [Rosistilla carotiformis]|uniref:Uncharacterized protein n=1 Tax=Rosistilla carotiformis TaxID=2528017 RepID=A0A518JQT8_9BACT|nr:prepilin-type N-terminal cleavage/methylation domain-containing protein [Rosistilla carotiformis]QDV67904.1 hypothetical protein Poly24_16090 [Rosistilla carotiformis]